MGQKAENSGQRNQMKLESGLEALRQSQAFYGPGDPPRDHDHANDHLALLYEDRDEQFAAAIPFIRQGLERGEQCLYIADDNSRDEVLTAMRAYNIDVDAALESGALSVLPPADTYRRTGEFDRDAMLKFWEDSLEQAKDIDGYTGLRAAAEMTWALDGETDPEGLIEYEAVLNSLYQDEDYVVLCQYNRKRFSPEMIHDVIKTHPHLIINNTVSRNFYYTPPEQFFDSEDLETKVNRMTQTLQEHTKAKTELHEHKDYLRELYEVSADSERSFEEKLHAIFELGCDHFDLELGGLARIDPEADLFQVEAINGDHEYLKPGAQIPLSETYSRVLTSDVEIAGITDPVDDGLNGTLAYDEFGVDSYIGTRVRLDDDVDRTLFFISSEPRSSAFSEAERTFHHLMGQWAQYELERQQRERELRERTEHLSALIETTPECIKTVAADGTLLQMNPAGLDMVEADSASDVIDECIYDLIAPEDRERFREFNEQICQGETGTLKFDIIGLEGTRHHMETHAAPLHRPNGTTAHVALTRNITGQVERNAELRRTKDRFETVFERSNDAMLLLDPVADEFIEVNSTALEMLGYERNELLDRGPSDLHPHEATQIRAFLDTLIEKGHGWTEELSWQAKDGEKIPVEISTSSFELENRSVMLAVVRDITERKKHEQYQRDLYDIIANPQASFDGKLNRLLELGCERFGLENGYFNHVNADTHEFEVIEAVGPHDLIEPGAKDSLEGTYCEMHLSSTEPLAAADVVDAGLDGLRAHNKYGLKAYFAATVHVGGDEYGTLCFASETPREKSFTEAEQTFLDLMGQCIGYELEHRRRERFLRESHAITADSDSEFEAKLKELLDLGREWMGLDAAGLTYLPERDGEFLTKYAVGYADEGRDESDTLWTDPSEGCFCRQAIRSDEPVGMADVRGTEWERDQIHQEHGLTCYLGTKVMNGSTPYGTLWVGSTEPRDREFTETERTFLELIGQWVSYEIEREHREQALKDSNKRLEQFAYAASHDLQEPLRMVSSYLQLLENQYGDAFDEDGEEFLQFAVEGADRMREMINGLLAYSRVETRADPFELVELETVLDYVLEDLQVQIDESNTEITVGDLPCVEGDRNQIRQVFQNLLENAITYSKCSSPRVHIEASRRKQEWVISVHDNGIGIEPDDQDRIFDIFDRLHSRQEYDGTGLGLALCERIVERHDGEIWVESEPGEGSTFSFTLPALD